MRTNMWLQPVTRGPIETLTRQLGPRWLGWDNKWEKFISKLYHSVYSSLVSEPIKYLRRLEDVCDTAISFNSPPKFNHMPFEAQSYITIGYGTKLFKSLIGQEKIVNKKTNKYCKFYNVPDTGVIGGPSVPLQPCPSSNSLFHPWGTSSVVDRRNSSLINF